MNTNVVDFVREASTEISTHDEGLLPTLTGKLPSGMVMYVAHTPKASLDDVVRVAVKAQSVGFRASPHIVARSAPRCTRWQKTWEPWPTSLDWRPPRMRCFSA
jgi:hypothetical protein